EIFSTIQERLPDAPVVKPEHLGTLRTLRDIAAFLSGAGAAAPAAAIVVTTATPDAIEPELDLSSLVRMELTSQELSEPGSRAPVPTLATGEIWVTDDGQGLADCLVSRLGLLGYTVRPIALAEYRAL